MQKRLILLILVAMFLIIAVLAGCSTGKTAAAQESTVDQDKEAAETTEAVVSTTEEELQTEETETVESASITDEEVLFDFYSPPSDWPKVVPIHTDMKVTAYDRTDNSMIASGYCEVDISRISNFYTNAQKEVGGGYPWEFDPDNESVTTGPDQVFYFISEEGQSLIVKIAEIEEGVLEFTLDFKE